MNAGTVEEPCKVSYEKLPQSSEDQCFFFTLLQVLRRNRESVIHKERSTHHNAVLLLDAGVELLLQGVPLGFGLFEDQQLLEKHQLLEVGHVELHGQAQVLVAQQLVLRVEVAD